MTPADILNFPGLSEHERRIVEMRVRDGLRPREVARRLQLTPVQVYRAMTMAKARAHGKFPPACTERVVGAKPCVMDAGWLDRNVAMYRKSEHPQNYLNGIAIVWGQAWADKVEAAANAPG